MFGNTEHLGKLVAADIIIHAELAVFAIPLAIFFAEITRTARRATQIDVVVTQKLEIFTRLFPIYKLPLNFFHKFEPDLSAF